MGSNDRAVPTDFRRQCLRAYLAFCGGATEWRETAELSDVRPRLDTSRTKDTFRFLHPRSA